MQQQDPSKGFEHFAKELVNVLKRVLGFCKHLLGEWHAINSIHSYFSVMLSTAHMGVCVMCRVHDAGAGRSDQTVQTGLIRGHGHVVYAPSAP
jgi:hypothetical protein